MNHRTPISYALSHPAVQEATDAVIKRLAEAGVCPEAFGPSYRDTLAGNINVTLYSFAGDAADMIREATGETQEYWVDQRYVAKVISTNEDA